MKEIDWSTKIDSLVLGRDLILIYVFKECDVQNDKTLPVKTYDYY